MNLKARYIVFGLLFVGSYGILLYKILEVNKWYFLAGEILLIVLVILFVLFYKRFLNPLQTISSGIALLKEKDFNTYLGKVGQKEVDGIIDVYNQMVTQLREEKIEKEEQNNFLDLLIQASPAGIIIMDLDGKVMQLNPSAVNMLEIEDVNEVLGKALNELKSPLARELSKFEDFRTDVVQLNGLNHYKVHRKYFMDKGFQRTFIMIEELSKEWVRAEKQSYEKVIRMMSHEVNNTVGSINSVLHSVVNLYNKSNDEYAEEVKEALDVSIERNENMNRFMANFASVVRVPEPNKARLDVTSLVDKTIFLFKADAEKRNIQLVNSTGKELFIEADQSQMEQVLSNIVKNSIEAIRENGEVHFVIEPMIPALRVMDNGKGISENSASRLFTPFYSDKKEGQGIGLTFVREVLLAHDFRFSLQRVDSDWTEFFIRF